MANFWDGFGGGSSAPAQTQTTAPPKTPVQKSQGFWNNFGGGSQASTPQVSTKTPGQVENEQVLKDTNKHTGIKDFISKDTPSTSVAKNFVKELPGAALDITGPFRQLPAAVTGSNEKSGQRTGDLNPDVIARQKSEGKIKDQNFTGKYNAPGSNVALNALESTPEAATKTAGGVLSFLAGSIVNPIIGVTEQATGKPIGHVGAPEFGLDFSSPQTQSEEYKRTHPGAGNFEAGLSTIATQAAGAGGLVGTFDQFKGAPEAATTIPKPEATLTPEPTQAPLKTGDGSLTLRSGVDPGIDKFIAKDIKPFGQKITGAFKEAKDTISPAYASKESLQAADAIRRAKASAVNAYDIEKAKNIETTKFFSGFNDETNISNISSYEKTGKFANAPAGYSEYFKKTTDEAYKIISDVTKNPVGYVENYVRRQFNFDTPIDEAKAQTYITNKVRSLSGSKSVLRQRTFNIPLDEAVNEMRSQGINVTPKFTNPELIRQSIIGNAVELKAYSELKASLKKQNLIKFVRAGNSAPPGSVKLDDPAFKVYFPGENFVTNGSYYANADVARVLNNAVSSGLESSKIFKGFRQISNGLNQYQLGLSGFHATFTAINSSISDLSLGMKQIIRGDFKTGFQTLGRGGIPGISAINSYIKGDAFIKSLKNTNPEAVKVLETKFNPGGGRLTLDSQYRIKAFENMKQAWNEGNILGAGIRLPGAIIEKVAYPLMQKAIPRIKIGAYLDLVSEIDKRMPEATSEMKARAYANAWDSMDNRFGQLTYDNLFWNKVTKDLAMASTRSVGWNLGTVREFGGAIKDVLTGKGFTDRAAYAIATPIYVGTLGAIYMYLHTGKAPQTLKDYFEPQNGQTDKYGNSVRVRLPTYMRDIAGYSTDPLGTVIHKTSPGINIISELAGNRDYYGDLIRNPDDPIGQQLQQVGQYVLTQMEPFSLQNLSKTASDKSTVEQKAESFGGIVQAPAKDIQSPEQQQYYKDLRQVYGQFAPRTPEDKQVADLKTQASDAIRSGGDFRPLLDQIRKLGGFKSKAEEISFIKGARKNIQQKQKSVDKILKFQGKK